MAREDDHSKRETVEAFLAALPVPAVLLDRNQTVSAANGPAREVLGVKEIGSDLSRSFRNPKLMEAVGQVLKDGGSKTCELHHGTTPHRIYDISVSGLALDSTPFVLLTFADQTTVHQVENIRSTFVANVSHELRSPLATLMGAIEALEGPAQDKPEDRLRMLSLMGQESRRMKALIEDLLSLSRIEAQEFIGPDQEVRLLPLLNVARDRLLDRAAQRSISISLVAAEDLPPVLGFEDELLEIFDNLIGNAVKYGAEGGMVNVTATATEQDVRIAVHNDGPPHFL